MEERVFTDRGELVLRSRDGHFELFSNGVFLMDTRSGLSGRMLVRAALAVAKPRPRLLIAGLGLGFSLAEAVRTAASEIIVVEVEPAVVNWHRGVLRPFSEGALDDPRVRLVTGDLAVWLTGTSDRFDAICLDVDNGPGWTVVDHATGLYRRSGLAMLREHLLPGGVLGVWSASPEPGFADTLTRLVGPVRTVRIPVRPGRPDVVHVASSAGNDRRDVRGVRRL
ncbi:spermidine synthase [Actinoplanes sp. NEAU-A12]|uniref:Spermidine synthase n=1 Tax=Actinoplanes sandaracinus TaxID=3045177 RepID=A0ABT6WBQ7_9ACTN|nr:spermidine synthase [Actinoplanes sandaracinus]MDI6097134.1 spermidine synthase [Actinoplanes sandaracinus]